MKDFILTLGMIAGITACAGCGNFGKSVPASRAISTNFVRMWECGGA